MIFQGVDYLKIIAQVIGEILTFLKPIVSPIGEWMVKWIEVALNVFPTNNLTLYIAIFIFLIATGAIVNAIWPGDKPPKHLVDKYQRLGLYDKKLRKAEEETEVSTEEIEKIDSYELEEKVEEQVLKEEEKEAPLSDEEDKEAPKSEDIEDLQESEEEKESETNNETDKT
ncbi:MAG: hypothetical protein ACTSRH_18570 [Promethearchaeota archaeon]